MASLYGVVIVCVALLFAYSEASHHNWDDHELTVLRASKAAKVANTVTPANDVYRTSFHFQPFGHWMNDPNAPLFYKGYYHLFYQYNPQSAVWGMIRWGHAVSKDLINWRHMKEAAIYPVEWYNLNGAWSGSATFLTKEGPPVILYTGNSNTSVQMTLKVVPSDPSDPLLKHWTQAPNNPVMVPRPSAINVSSFRDPTTAWKVGNTWRVLVGNKKLYHNHVGMALVYKSTDFVTWTKAKRPLHSANTGMWECPDFYPVPLSGRSGIQDTWDNSRVKHVLKNSLDDYKVDYYTIGTYHPLPFDKYVPDNNTVEGPDGLRYDYGKFYASKTFFDTATSRRILFGWINESDSVSDDVVRGWAGVQAIPREVWLDEDTHESLMQWPVRELESLRREKVELDNVVMDKHSLHKVEGLKYGASTIDVEVEFEWSEKSSPHAFYERVGTFVGVTPQSLCVGAGDKSGNLTENGFGIMVLASNDLSERSSVFFKFFTDGKAYKTVLCVDQSRSTLQEDADKTSYGGFVNVSPLANSLSLRVLVDRSIVESFAGGGKTCITSRSYPTKAVERAVNLFVFNHHPSSSVKLRKLSAWHIDSAKTIYEAAV